MSQVDPALDAEPIRRMMELSTNPLGGKLQMLLAEVKSQLQDVALVLTDAGEAEKVEEIRNTFKGILAVGGEMDVHKGALDQMKRSYSASSDPSNFKELIKNYCEAQPKPDLDQHAELVAFDKEIGRDGGAGGEDEEVMMENGGGFMNEKCPLTLKNVMELDDPVEDSKGYIYERHAIETYIRKEARSQGPIKCPVAGTNHYITLAELKPAASIRRAKRRALFTQSAPGGTHAQARQAEVLDASDED